ncbi:hypothetical protein ACFSKI_04485 [Pseudogracilibacillus auburnensis]|uniref:Uncharacterized protein n=1 Tax=Pseudogracilibacillus auburnensis TaxID=1494959 RepID=A0A2V3VF47_9BACI|nr:hypothetical protein [Pseudogracilibacillus auburnensis]PXW80357.1 hypothetical protein DFR56_12911 [Pseudogracilibacillus auburnensis]
MNRDNGTTDGTMEKQRQEIERKKQYDIVTGLGWRNFGIAFLVIVIAIVIYAVFFR